MIQKRFAIKMHVFATPALLVSFWSWRWQNLQKLLYNTASLGITV